MKYIFYSYYIGLLLKGKLKAVQISFSAVITAIVVFANAQGSINYIIGKSSNEIDLLFLALFIYSLMNFGYAVFNRYAPSPILTGPKEEIKNSLLVHKTISGTEKNKGIAYSILQNKSYGSGIKSSPKVTGMKTETVVRKEPIKSAKAANDKADREEMSAPAVEINIQSTQEFFEEEKEEYHRTYSGVINENYAFDIMDVPEIG